MGESEIPGFGETVAMFRTRAGLSQQKVASALGMSRRAIAAWEAGDNLPKSKGTVLELARILKLNDGEATTLLKAAGIDPSLTICNIPYPRNPFFTGRGQELEYLHVQLHQGTSAVVGQMQSISGLGGIGKTQLTVEYAYRHQDEYQYVLWARAESVEALTASFAEIANRLNLPEKDEEEQAIMIQAVKRWLQRHRGWLLILDNADHPALLPDFLPPTVGGHLLITTRAAELNAHIAGLAHSHVVESFSNEQGALFLLYRCNLLALAIAHELGGLPLALDQAGAYLKATRCTLATYQQLYQQRRTQLLTERRGKEHPEPVATTWNLSFQQVEQLNPAAAELLRLCAFLAPEAIPEEIITKGGQALSTLLVPLASDAYLLNQAIERLSAYSLMTRDPRTQMLTVHRLVQVVLRDSLSYEDYERWKRRAACIVAQAYPPLEFAHWSTHERLLPHALVCARWVEEGPIFSQFAADLLTSAGIYLSARGRYREAEPLLKRALSIVEQRFGSSHSRMASNLQHLAALYRKQGKYAEAEPLFLRALSIYEREPGISQSEVAISLINLATLYQDWGKYKEAEPLYLRALPICERELGASHPNTATCLHNLAVLYTSQERYKEAEPLHRRALSIREQHLEATHLDIVYSLFNLAALYRAQNKDEEAEPLEQRAFSICMLQLRSHYPDMANLLNAWIAFFERTWGQEYPLIQQLKGNFMKVLSEIHTDEDLLAFLQAFAQGMLDNDKDDGTGKGTPL